MGQAGLSMVLGGLLLASAAAAQAGDDAVRIVDEGRLGETWKAAGEAFAAPGYPAAYADSGDDVCLAIGYSVDEQGRTGDFSVLREWSSAGEDPGAEYWDAFAQAGAHAIAQWRFAPRDGGMARPTYTVSRVAFAGSGDPAAVREQCRVGDLAGLLQAEKSNYVMDRSLLKRDMERQGRIADADARARAAAAAMARRPNASRPPSNPAR
jgi:hypothetical protein